MLATAPKLVQLVVPTVEITYVLPEIILAAATVDAILFASVPVEV